MILKRIGNIFHKEATMEADQLKRLSEHKYKADDQSILTDLFFKYFWDWFTNLYPLWLAPNVITFVGMIVNSIATLIMAWYSPDCTQKIPNWAFLLCALALFIYQTLDSTDGKQARRTHTSSPLGELFDHGCDSFTQVFLALQISLALSLGDTRWGVMGFYVPAIYMFYAAHWQTYATGVLKFGKFDIIESQCVIITILVLSGLFGSEFWFAEVFGYTMRRIILMPCGLIAIYVSSVVLYTIYTEAAGKNGTTVANTSVTIPIFPVLSFLIPPILAYWKSTSGIFDHNIVLFCLAFGMPSVKITSRVILAHMSRSPLAMLDTILIGPILVLINQYLDNILPEALVLYLCLIYGFINLTYYAYVVTQQSCEYLKIQCFHIPYPPPMVKNGPISNGHIKNGMNGVNGLMNGVNGVDHH